MKTETIYEWVITIELFCKTTSFLSQTLIKSIGTVKYSVYQGFSKAKFDNGGSILSSS